jgi:hypothetical protein
MKTQEKMIKTASPFEQNATLVYYSIVPQKKSNFWQAGQLRPSAATCALNPIMKLIMKLPLFLCLLMTSIATATEDVGDPVVWMDAGSGIEADGKALISWQSRNGAYIATPPEDASGPELLPDGIAGKPAIQFGGSAYLSGPLTEELGEEATFIAVVDIPSGEQSGNVGIMMLSYTYGLSVNQDKDPFYSMITYWPKMLEKYDEEKATPVRGGILRAEKNIGFEGPCIVTVICGAEKSTIYVNGSPVADVDLGIFAKQGKGEQLGLGANGGKRSKPMTGKIAEALLYNEALSPEKRTAVEKSLAAKYKVQLSH